MKVFIAVEGRSDEAALRALWKRWLPELRQRGIGVEFIVFKSKPELLKGIGLRAGEKLCNNTDDLFVGLPDLYPTVGFAERYRHGDFNELRDLQKREVRRQLIETYRVRKDSVDTYLDRFKASALKYDLEMLLLAASPYLTKYLNAKRELATWRRPAEDQNDDHPPKRVVQELFSRFGERGKSTYLDTIHAPAVLSMVQSINEVLQDAKGQWQCPKFWLLCEWLGNKTGVPVC